MNLKSHHNEEQGLQFNELTEDKNKHKMNISLQTTFDYLLINKLDKAKRKNQKLERRENQE